MRFRNESEIDEMIGTFEAGTIAEDDWHHDEHLIVACRYLSELPFEDALDKMRQGIFGLLRALGVTDIASSPYNETLTRFWMLAVADFVARNRGLGFFELCEALTATLEKDRHERYYSRELLFSDEARLNFVAPDKRELDFLEIPDIR